eukprot:TRINITY_DN1400_c0_g2_i2.p1 TRINITY_DN1400_c0_g2~~TRINITY_DN1400_c0_g2_i2.p1  ORF type:complete len:511 (-),score=116.47 TRINITY_DN1400_c0_g2_i2:205-1593(-)
MASLRGFFGLAISLCLFYYDEALRRDADDEDLSSRESSEFRKVSSDLLELRDARTNAKSVRSHDAREEEKEVSSNLLELRDARTNAKLVRSHDASFFFKRGGDKTKEKKEEQKGDEETKDWENDGDEDETKEGEKKVTTKKKKSTGCPVKVAESTFKYEGLSSMCCEDLQAWVCHGFKDYEVSWKRPLCDKFSVRSEMSEMCTGQSDEDVLLGSSTFTGMKDAVSRELSKLIEQSNVPCSVKVANTTCEFERLSPPCCEELQAKNKDFVFLSIVCSGDADAAALAENTTASKCLEDASNREMIRNTSSVTPMVTPSEGDKKGDKEEKNQEETEGDKKEMNKEEKKEEEKEGDMAEEKEMSSNLLELRDARTNAELVRSHDASFFFKRGGDKTKEKKEEQKGDEETKDWENDGDEDETKEGENEEDEKTKGEKEGQTEEEPEGDKDVNTEEKNEEGKEGNVEE